MKLANENSSAPLDSILFPNASQDISAMKLQKPSQLLKGTMVVLTMLKLCIVWGRRKSVDLCITGAVVQFVDFGPRLLRGRRGLCKSLTGALPLTRSL